MPMMFLVKFFKGLGSIVIMLSLLILGLMFIIAPTLTAELGMLFLKAAE